MSWKEWFLIGLIISAVLTVITGQPMLMALFGPFLLGPYIFGGRRHHQDERFSNPPPTQQPSSSGINWPLSILITLGIALAFYFLTGKPWLEFRF